MAFTLDGVQCQVLACHFGPMSEIALILVPRRDEGLHRQTPGGGDCDQFGCPDCGGAQKFAMPPADVVELRAIVRQLECEVCHLRAVIVMSGDFSETRRGRSSRAVRSRGITTRRRVSLAAATMATALGLWTPRRRS